MFTINLTEMDHSKTIFFALVLPKVSCSLLELPAISKSSSVKEKQHKSTRNTFSKAETDFQKGFFILSHSLPTFETHLPLPPEENRT